MNTLNWRSASTPPQPPMCICIYTCLQACQQILHVLHMHEGCTCLSSSTGLHKAIHEQQALLTTLAPLHWQAKNIREENTHTRKHTHIKTLAHIDRDGKQRGQRRKKGGRKRGQEHCSTREPEDKIYWKIPNTDRIKFPFVLSVHSSTHPTVYLSFYHSVLAPVLPIKGRNGSFLWNKFWSKLWWDSRGEMNKCVYKDWYFLSSEYHTWTKGLT